MKGRILFGILAVIFALILPWWFFILIAILGTYRYSPWLEGIAIGLFFDLVFSVPLTHFHNFQFVYTSITLISIIAMYFIKKKIINV